MVDKKGVINNRNNLINLSGNWKSAGNSFNLDRDNTFNPSGNLSSAGNSFNLDRNHNRLYSLLKTYSPAQFGYEYE